MLMMFVTIAVEVSRLEIVRRVLVGSIRLLLAVVDVSAANCGTFRRCNRHRRPWASWTQVDVSNLVPMLPPINHRIINRKAEEECQRRHLEPQSSQGKMCSGRVKTDGHAGNSTTSGLQDQ